VIKDRVAVIADNVLHDLSLVLLWRWLGHQHEPESALRGMSDPAERWPVGVRRWLRLAGVQPPGERQAGREGADEFPIHH